MNNLHEVENTVEMPFAALSAESVKSEDTWTPRPEARR